MLYDRWRQLADHRRDELALIDANAGQHWTFGQLAGAADAPKGPAGQLVCPQGMSPEFLFAVLRAWRDRAVLCPLEPGQAPPDVADLPSGCVHLKTTSASTGQAQFIAFTAAQLQADVDQIVTTMGLRPEWPNLGVISLAHSYGFSNLVLPLFLHGVPLILAASPLPEALRAAARLAPELTLAAVPALWRAWLDAHALPGGVRLAISAGAPLPLALESNVFAEASIKIHNFYGASECGGIAYDRSTLPRTDASCVGSPMEKVKLSVSPEGRLRVCSPAVGSSYWPHPSPALSHGVFQTSDLAQLKDGLVYLLGRESDQINVAGRKLSPESIERVLATHPQVRDCLVFGAPSPDADRAEIVVACVVAAKGTDADALKQHLLKCVPAWQVPRAWWFVKSLEANARGKLARRLWRQRFLEKG